MEPGVGRLSEPLVPTPGLGTASGDLVSTWIHLTFQYRTSPSLWLPSPWSCLFLWPLALYPLPASSPSRCPPQSAWKSLPPSVCPQSLLFTFSGPFLLSRCLQGCWGLWLGQCRRLVPGLVEAGAEASPRSLCFQGARIPPSPDQDAVICGRHHYCVPTVCQTPSCVLRSAISHPQKTTQGECHCPCHRRTGQDEEVKGLGLESQVCIFRSPSPTYLSITTSYLYTDLNPASATAAPEKPIQKDTWQ